MLPPFSIPGLAAFIAWSACGLTSGAATEAGPTVEGIAFFEARVRPLLMAECYGCHSPEKKIKGGLRLDIRDGWSQGGDSGPAILPGNIDKSLLIAAVRYTDPDLQMPPKHRLTDRQIADLENWVSLGAPDPREGKAQVAEIAGLDLEEGRKFWAYQPPRPVPPPEVNEKDWPRNALDHFVLSKLEARALRPVPDADRVTLIRRAYFHLIGLPPTPEEIDAFVDDTGPDAFGHLVDRLLASPQFGERWGRHWLDVVRYAESVTLRGLIFKEAWRYRDYVIDAFNRDLPYDRFLTEQVAGDLMPADSRAEERRQMIATTFLALGNTNLEEQDKEQLRMDVVDEQLDTIGKAFLGQTLGCARCHDHKFDPIPTRDYYALAAILRNADMVDDGNVSNWTERPLPLEPEQEAVFQHHEAEIAELKDHLKAAQEAAQGTMAGGEAILAPERLPGIVVDDAEAKRIGAWQHSTYSRRYVGGGYLHDIDAGKGEKTLTFLPALPHAGSYEVRLAYVPGDSRATNVPVTIFSADGEKTVLVNQRKPPPLDGRFISLGEHRFERNGQGFVLVSTAETRGHVIADAVQFIPAESADATVADHSDQASGTVPTGEEIRRLEARLKEVTEHAALRPRVMTVKEAKEIKGMRVHIRGSVKNQGDPVERGFLQVMGTRPTPVFPEAQSGRLQLGAWLADRSNPLPARVMVNRVWHWLFGAGIVRTTDNFGTTGELPSHPELLDDLAVRFMDEGWSVKKLVREIVLSRTWQLSSEADDASIAADPENRLLWRMNRQRLEAECLRDAMLSISGQLDPVQGGPTIRPGTGEDYGYQHTETRRSVYAPVFRNALPEALEIFDFPDPSMVVGRRNASIVAPQALFLMNHPFVSEQAEHAARRLLEADDREPSSQIRHAYRLVLGRVPTAAETELVAGFLTQPENTGESRIATWVAIFTSLFSTMDFRYLH